MINMKAKKVYEFKRTRKQGLSKQTEIGLTIYKRKEIEKWLDEYVPDKNYEINDDLSVIIDYNLLILENKQITEIPINDLTVKYSMDLQNTHHISKLPDKLKVINYLCIENTNITELPEDIDIGASLFLSNTRISKLPNNIFKKDDVNGLYIPGNLYLENTNVSELPDNLTIYGTLTIQGSKITKIPENLYIMRDLYLDTNVFSHNDLPYSLFVVGEIKYV